ncbi:hypothetical protein CJD36_020750 [Flavipsychrobacter stenotrophus]|uniref:HNH nuclease domain-containing protein n=2 Tax=Flavipsychrobacter stenotrophus TaxID=2077091 RepID=A0A2S7SQR2_9BACT|nr:hypothetical protein CJD36_020750 [Flavipsychrobacter stenotrophus]
MQPGFSLTPALSKGEGGVTRDNSDTLRQSGDCHPLNRRQSLCLASDNNREIKLSECNNLKIVSKRATPREPGWRLRYMVLKRDLFRCVACGASPATNLGTVLHVDHIVAYSIGGESVMENLQTLCEVCNGGKGNL